MGRTPEGHQVRLMKMYGISRLLLQELAMLFCVQHVKVDVNDLYTWTEKEKEAFAGDGGRIKVPVWRALFDFFRVPLVKRANAMISSMVFLLLQVRLKRGRVRLPPAAGARLRGVGLGFLLLQVRLRLRVRSSSSCRS